ncbi:sulfite exporter TauE/SafE family protein [Candidatus Fermentibacteria bacterium]|nr:MAG: sulfite exporter TauE/SafE family protein [Candidatus Fermentibacteria bacterium]
MTPVNAILLFLAGIAAGFVNVNAGGGSFLTIPLLIILGGLPATAANASNRVAILLQNVIAARNFRRHGFRDIRQGIKLGLSAMAGAVIGSMIALDVPENVFRTILSVIMVLALVVILHTNRKKCAEHISEQLRHPVLQVFMFFFIGIYGGFIQAGTGYLVICSLSIIGGLSLVKTNSLKIIIIAAYLIPSILVFLLNGEIRWFPALVLAAGTSIGGWFGSTFAIRKGDRWIKIILVAAILVMAAKMIGLF